MHPLVGRFSLGAWSLPSGPLLGLVGLLALGALWVGWRRRRWALCASGLLAALLVVSVAAQGWGEPYVARPLVVTSFGALLAVACVVLWMGTERGLAREGAAHPAGVLAWAPAAAALGALVGARALYVIGNGVPPARWLALGDGGLSGLGALAGGLALAALVCRRSPKTFFALVDAAAPALAFAIVAIRLGCYLQGCDFGVPWTGEVPSWLARLVTFPRWEDVVTLGAGPPVLEHHRAAGLVAAAAEASLPVHPTQLYEALLGLLLLGALLWLGPRAPFRGARGLSVVAAHALGAAALTPLHAAPEGSRATPAVGLALAVTCVVLIWRQRRVAQNVPE